MFYLKTYVIQLNKPLETRVLDIYYLVLIDYIYDILVK